MGVGLEVPNMGFRVQSFWVGGLKLKVECKFYNFQV